MSGPTGRRRLAVLVTLAAGLFGWRALFATEAGNPQNPPAADRFALVVREDQVLSQLVRLDASGLNGVTLYPDRDATRAGGDAVVEIWKLPPRWPVPTNERDELVLRSARSAASLAESDAWELSLPPQIDSRGRMFRVDLRSANAGEGEGFAVIANAWGGQDPETLTLDGREVWGRLAFRTSATDATGAGNLILMLRRMTGRRDVRWLLAGGVGLLLLALAGFLVESFGGPAVTLAMAGPVRRPAPIELGVRALVALAVVGAVIVIVRASAREDRLEPDAIDLVARFPEADKRTTMPTLRSAFGVTDVTIDGVRRRSLVAHPFSRVTWSVDVPAACVLRAAAAYLPETWDNPGDGSTVRIGVSDGERYAELYRRYLMPFVRTEDRRWFDIEIDLSAYAGRRVDLIFNTEPGEAGNAVGDAPVWGRPRLVPNAVRRAPR
ncbi:MAG: hypothetical protein U0Q12_10490 [Vicinamibacterales bacterium]